MTNKNQERATPLQLTTPSGQTIASGAAVLFGKTSGHQVPGIYTAEKSSANPVPPQDSSSNQVTVDMEGVFNLTVVAKSSLSPSTGAAVAIGDELYYDGGTLDGPTGITYGGTIDKNNSGVPFGIALDALGSGLTSVIRVVIGK